MKITKILLTITTILFALLGLLKKVVFDVTQPLMSFSLATLLLLLGIEDKKKNYKLGFIINTVLAVLLYIVIVYNVFIG